MPTIYCSAKLTKLIGPDRILKRNISEPREDLGAWNAQLFYKEGRKCVIVTNKLTLYSFVRLNVLKKDFKDLDVFFRDSLERQLHADNLKPVVKMAFDLETEVSFFRTDNDKKTIGSINDLIYNLDFIIDYRYKGLQFTTDTDAGTFVNRMIMKAFKYNSPLDQLKIYGEEM